MSIRDSRKQYWDNNYYQYWKDRVSEAKGESGKSKVVAGDTKTENIDVYSNLFNHYGFKQGAVLDIGCAWGRMFELYLDHQLLIFGVDISSEMINQARSKWGYNKSVCELSESIAEELPYSENSFDNVVCIATFDATYQSKAINEILRVTKPGGLIYITGKNISYYVNDTLALEAEAGARSKGHPNFFTDTRGMVESLELAEHELVAKYFFERRGDFAELKFVNNMPDMFYEYLLIIRKGNSTKPVAFESSEFSQTFKNLDI